MTREREQERARKIEAYWRERGFKVETRISGWRTGSKNPKQVWQTRSDIVMRVPTI